MVRIIVTGGPPAIPNKKSGGGSSSSSSSSKPNPYVNDQVGLYTSIDNIGAGSTVEKAVAIPISQTYTPGAGTPVTSITEKPYRRSGGGGGGGSRYIPPTTPETYVKITTESPQPIESKTSIDYAPTYQPVSARYNDVYYTADRSYVPTSPKTIVAYTTPTGELTGQTNVEGFQFPTEYTTSEGQKTGVKINIKEGDTAQILTENVLAGEITTQREPVTITGLYTKERAPTVVEERGTRVIQKPLFDNTLDRALTSIGSKAYDISYTILPVKTLGVATGANVLYGAGTAIAKDIVVPVIESTSKVILSGQKDLTEQFLPGYLEQREALTAPAFRGEYGKVITETYNAEPTGGEVLTSSLLLLPLAPKKLEAIGSTALGVYGGLQLGRKFATEGLPTDSRSIGADIAIVGLTAAAFIPAARLAKTEIQRLRETPAIEEEISFNINDPRILEQSRQRAVIIPEVVTAEGKSKGVVLGRGKSGEAIFLGGKPNPGETILQAAIRELGEESGAKIEKFSEVKQLPRLITAEETQNVYTGKISEATFKDLVPRSDIVKFELVPPEDFAKFTGPTAKTPRFVTQGTELQILFGGGIPIRVSEATYLGRFREFQESKLSIAELEARTKQTKLVLQVAGDKKIEAYLQSRYNIPGSIQEKYFDVEINKLIYTKQKVPVSGEQLTVSGLTDKQLSDLIVTSTYRKVVPKPQLLVSGTAKDLILTNGDLIIQPGITKRGGAPFYLQPPVKPGGRGYLGLSYVLGGGEEVSLGLLPKSSKRTVIYTSSIVDKTTFNIAKQELATGKGINRVQDILNERAPFGKVGATAKTAGGKETELALYYGGLKFTGRKSITFLEGQPVEFRETRRITNPKVLRELQQRQAVIESPTSTIKERFLAKKEVERITGIKAEEFSPRPTRRIISPIEIAPKYDIVKTRTTREAPLVNISEKNIKTSFVTSENILYNYEKVQEKPLPTYEPNFEKPTTTGEKIAYNQRYATEEILRKNLRFSEPRFNIAERRQFNMLNTPKVSAGFREPKQKRKVARAYSVLLKRRGKYIPIATSLPRGRAVLFGQQAALGGLGRTFKLRETGETTIADIDLRADEKLFRGYVVRKGKAIATPNTFIQRQRYSLVTPQERTEIKLAREMKAMQKLI